MTTITSRIRVGEDKTLNSHLAAVEALLVERLGGPAPDLGSRAAGMAEVSTKDLARMKHGMACVDLPDLGNRARYMAGAPGIVTDDFTVLLGSAAGRMLVEGYRSGPRAWQTPGLVKIRTVDNFKPLDAVKVGIFPALEEIAEGGTYSVVSVGEESHRYTLAKYGKIVSFSKEALLADSLDAFGTLLTRAGDAAARLTSNVVFSQIIGWASGVVMADGKALFHTDHNNLAGSPAALSATTLGTGVASMLGQTDIDTSEAASVDPRFLVVPAALAITARGLLEDITSPPGQESDMQVVVESLLDSGSPGSSTTAFYLFGHTSQIDTIEVALMRGEEEPALDRKMSFDADVTQFKVRHLVGARAVDHRGMYRDAGA